MKRITIFCFVSLFSVLHFCAALTAQTSPGTFPGKTGVVSEYNWQYPSIHSNEFTVIHHVTNDLVYAAGVGGMIIKSIDGGNTWIDVPTPFINNITDLHFHNGDHLRLVVTGPAGFLATSVDGGSNWVVRDTQTTNNLLSVRFIDQNSLVAVGASKTVSFSDDFGATWVPNLLASDSVWNPNNKTNWSFRGLAVAQNTLYMGVDGGGMPMQVLRTSDKGLEWHNAVDSTLVPGSFTAQRITGMSFSADGQIGYATAHVGFSGIIMRTTDAGLNWSQVPIPSFTLLPSSSPHTYSTKYPGQGISISSDGTKILSVATFGQTLASIDSGENWFELYGGHLQGKRDFSGMTLYGVSIAPNNNWLVAGRRGLIAGADNFIAGTAVVKNGIEQNTLFTGVTFTDDLSGFVSGYRIAEEWVVVEESTVIQSVDQGLFYKTTDGGNTWTPQQSPGLNDGYRWHSITSQNNNIWIAGDSYLDTLGVIKYSSDNGLTWTTEASPEHVVIDIVSWDDQHVYAITKTSQFLKRNNDGTWESSQLPEATATRPALTLEVVAPDVVFVGGGATSGSANTPFIIKTENGGADWTTSFTITGAGLIESIHFMDGAFGVAGGIWGPFANKRNILVTEDHGNTWFAPDATYMGTSSVRMKYFHTQNNQTVRAYGASGHIVKTTNPSTGFTYIDESPSGNDFSDGHALNANNAWMVGADSKILKFQADEQTNSAPTRFANIIPAPAQEIEITHEGFTFTWSPSSDPDGGDVTYQFILESTDGLTNYLQMDVAENSVTVYDTDLPDFVDGTYQWKVIAKTANEQTATTYPTSANITVIELETFTLDFVVVDADLQAVEDAVITLNGQVFSPGVYSFNLIPATYEYTVSKDGFHDTSGNVEITDANVTLDITMISSSVILSEYHWQYPSLNSNEIVVIKHVTNDLVFAAGAGGMILKSIDAGNTWAVVPVTFQNHLSDLAFLQGEELHLAVAGNDGFVAISNDGGATWTVSNTETTNNLFSIGFLNSTTLITLGANQTVLISSDGGATWTGSPEAITAVHNPNNKTNWTFRTVAVTPSYVYISVDGGGMPMQVLRSANNGLTWESVLVTGDSTPSSFAAVRVTGISFAADGLTAYASGTLSVTGRIINTVDGGTTWTISDLSTITPLPNPDVPYLATSITARQSISISSDGTKIISGGANGLILASIDSGLSWYELYGGPRQGLRDLWSTQIYGVSISPNNSWLAAGQRGIITGSSVFTAGSGVLKHGDEQKKDFKGIVFTSELNGYATGYRQAEQYIGEGTAVDQLGIGLFYTTNDAGQTWTAQENDLIDGFRWYTIAKDNNNKLWIGGQEFPGTTGIIKSSTDNGLTWTTEITVDQPVNEIAIWDQNHVYAVTEGNIFISMNDNGELVASDLPEPVVITTNPVLSLEVVAPGVVFAGGGRTSTNGSPFILKSTDGGLTWTQVFSLASGNGMITNIQFMDGAFGVASGMWGPTLSRINVLVTKDYGQTWDAPELTYNGANHGRINHFHIANSQDITAYGISGHILRTINEDLDFHYIEERPTGNVFNSGFSLNANNAWVIGENSTILKFEALEQANSAPSKFANMLPAPAANAHITPAGFTFTWSESINPDGGDISYTFVLESTDGVTNFMETVVNENSITLFNTDFDLIPDGTYNWRVIAKTASNEMATTHPSSVNITTGELELYTITFLVQDGNEAPITDAVITLDGVSYDAGLYQFDVMPGTYDYVVAKGGFTSATGQVIVTDADITESVTLNLITFELAFTVTQSGGDAITDAVISIDGVAFGAGVYQFDLVPGTYDYSVEKAGFNIVNGQVVITDADVTENVSLTLITYQLSFVVEDGSGSSIADAVITIDGISSPAGLYEFDLVPATYDYTVSKAGYNTQAGQVTIANADVVQQVTLTVVTYQLTFEVEDNNGNAIADAVVAIDGVSYDAGLYQFELAAGTYAYTVNKAGYIAAAGQVVITDADVTEQVTLTLITFQLTFDVEDNNGNAIADAIVTLEGVSYDAGEYQFDLAPGTYAYSVGKDGYTTTDGQLVITDADVTEEVVLTLVTFQLTFIVEDNDGNTLTDAVVSIDGISYDPGVYQFDLAPGTYSYTVSKEGFNTQTGEVVITDTDLTETVILTLVTFNLTFQVEDTQGVSISDAVITLNEVTYSAGTYTFDVIPAEYNYVITRDNYYDESGTITVIDSDELVVVQLEIIVSVPQVDSESISLYPNPASSFLTIESDLTISEIRAFDLLGQIVYSKITNNGMHRINVADWQKGIYLIQVFTSRGVETHRIQVSD